MESLQLLSESQQLQKQCCSILLQFQDRVQLLIASGLWVAQPAFLCPAQATIIKDMLLSSSSVFACCAMTWPVLIMVGDRSSWMSWGQSRVCQVHAWCMCPQVVWILMRHG